MIEIIQEREWVEETLPDGTITRYEIPRIGRCHCGAEVELMYFTNTCEKCGRDYNTAGQELAPREQWGEETGESLGDILRIK